MSIPIYFKPFLYMTDKLLIILSMKWQFERKLISAKFFPCKELNLFTLLRIQNGKKHFIEDTEYTFMHIKKKKNHLNILVRGQVAMPPSGESQILNIPHSSSIYKN